MCNWKQRRHGRFRMLPTRPRVQENASNITIPTRPEMAPGPRRLVWSLGPKCWVMSKRHPACRGWGMLVWTLSLGAPGLADTGSGLGADSSSSYPGPHWMRSPLCWRLGRRLAEAKVYRGWRALGYRQRASAASTFCIGSRRGESKAASRWVYVQYVGVFDDGDGMAWYGMAGCVVVSWLARNAEGTIQPHNTSLPRHSPMPTLKYRARFPSTIRHIESLPELGRTL